MPSRLFYMPDFSFTENPVEVLPVLITQLDQQNQCKTKCIFKTKWSRRIVLKYIYDQMVLNV